MLSFIAALKADKKRLKAEKFDLLNQMKQLYATLEDKEKELRDFIRNYEQVIFWPNCYSNLEYSTLVLCVHYGHKKQSLLEKHVNTITRYEQMLTFSRKERPV